MSLPAESPKGLTRCAIYTRKSSTVRLDQPLNSLETQREVCSAYIKSQSHRAWTEVPEKYDDGGYSGGTLRRPALKRLINDVEDGLIDIIVIYKIDRLSRSLLDFIRLMDLLKKHDASFVSVTQTFDTSDSMGRLILNILLTFAQFERELASERIRDRLADRRRRGYFCGGAPPLGYVIRPSGRIVPDPMRADAVRDLFLDLPTMSVTSLTQRLADQGFTLPLRFSKAGNQIGGHACDISRILKLLRNPVYAGHYREGDELRPCNIEPLITLEQWKSAQHILDTRYSHEHLPNANFLLDILHDQHGRRMRMSRTDKDRCKRRRYVSGPGAWAGRTPKIYVDAGRVEQLALGALRAFLADRVALNRAILSLGRYSNGIASRVARGDLAARRLEKMQGVQIRECVLALIKRAEVSSQELRLVVDCFELSRYLDWDGKGIFSRTDLRPRGADHFRMISAPALIVQTSAFATVPLKPRTGPTCAANQALVKLLDQASEIRRQMMNDRSISIGQVAKNYNMGTRNVARIYRLNYLAPDIQAAIIDGTQPATLTRNELLFGSLPLDWQQQRHLWGFADPLRT